MLLELRLETRLKGGHIRSQAFHSIFELLLLRFEENLPISLQGSQKAAQDRLLPVAQGLLADRAPVYRHFQRSLLDQVKVGVKARLHIRRLGKADEVAGDLDPLLRNEAPAHLQFD